MARRNKSAGNYNHIPTNIDGIKFASKLEARFYKCLKEAKKNEIIKDFKRADTYLLQEKYIIVNNKVIYGNDPDFNRIHRKTKTPIISAIKYTPDFFITFPDDSFKIIETKGLSKPDFELRKRLFLALHPEFYDSYKVINYDEETDSWMDYYELDKLIKQRKKERQAEREAKKAEKERLKAKRLAEREAKKAEREKRRAEREAKKMSCKTKKQSTKTKTKAKTKSKTKTSNC